MTTASTINQFTNNIRRKSEDVDRGYRLLTIVGFFIDAVALKYQGKKAISLIREMMNECDSVCPTAGCMITRREQSILIRDNLLKLARKMDSEKFPLVICNAFRQMAEDWDDLAEDCSIGSDQEIRNLLSEIAEKL